jgi:threonine dehydrogenase-like Zn-dependent dehydrogenase
MRAVVFDQSLHFTDSAGQREPKPGEIAVDVIVAGICETDLQLCRGYMGFRGTLGHEFVGVARSGRFAGRRVVGEINCACHVCVTCRRGLPRHCPERTVIGILNHDGAFADMVLVPEANLLAVPDHVPDNVAVFVEPVAAACRIREQIPLHAGLDVVVLGDGRLGNLCAQVLKHHGCQVEVIGRHEFKLRLLRSLGITALRREDLPTGRRAEVVVDCTGSSTGLALALELVRPCGTIILKTTVAAAHSLAMAPVVIDEVTVIGSRCGPFAPALELLASGAVQVEPLLSGTYPLESAAEAFDHAIRKDALKVLFAVRELPAR